MQGKKWKKKFSEEQFKMLKEEGTELPSNFFKMTTLEIAKNLLGCYVTSSPS